MTPLSPILPRAVAGTPISPRSIASSRAQMRTWPKCAAIWKRMWLTAWLLRRGETKGNDSTRLYRVSAGRSTICAHCSPTS